jgi:hypothetical protein
MRRPDLDRIEYDALSTGLDRIVMNTNALIDYIGHLELRAATLHAMLVEEVDRARTAK